MSAVVIDTNVLLVASRRHDGVSEPCIAACIKRLTGVRADGVVVLDDGRRIVGEYLDNFKHSRQPGVGDAFLKWLLQNLANIERVAQVKIDEPVQDEFTQFPDAALQVVFDRKDRKFVATAAAHADKPPIIQAADGKWAGWWGQLSQHGVVVHFPCPHDIKRFYAGAFPKAPAPTLPGDAP
jgi:hypothetical protein